LSQPSARAAVATSPGIALAFAGKGPSLELVAQPVRPRSGTISEGLRTSNSGKIGLALTVEEISERPLTDLDSALAPQLIIV
jgi:hypothetical protein